MLVLAHSNQPWSSVFPTIHLLGSCRTLDDVSKVHAQLITTGFIKNPNLTTRIVLAFASSRRPCLAEFARCVFFEYHACSVLPGEVEDPFLWNAMIKSHSHGHGPTGALLLLCLMLESCVHVDKFSFSLVLKACSRLGLMREGMQIHGFLRKTGIWSNLFLQNGLIRLYLRCGCLGLARQIFDRIPQRDSVSYNSMIDGYVKCGLIECAAELFDLMSEEEKNLISWNSMISGYAQTADGLNMARKLFDEMPEKDLISWNSMIDGCVKHGKMEDAMDLFDVMPRRDVVTWATMIDGYAKLGQVHQAKSLFEQMPQRDVVVCNSMMAGYTQNGYYMEALKIFDYMEREGSLSPDETTLVIVLSAISQLGHFSKAMSMHLYIAEKGFRLGGKLGVALIDMYSKCGSIQNATWVFEGIENKNIDHWNAMIGGLAVHGLGDAAFDLLMQMERHSVKPDDITFIGILSACSHSGLVKEGLLCFELMRRKHKIEPRLQHYGCMVDILARSGSIELAERLIEEMPIEPNDIIWRTFLSACSNHSCLKTGELVAKHLMGQAGYNPSSYVLLSNMYAGLGMWEDVRRVRMMMKKRKLQKIPGCSWIELDGRVHEFFVQVKSPCT
ncbi:PREDICTED: pentatricopeptide repeat-containing protein At2g45350, chloroplastic [Tarenaya hassleriana]|uniref:pentatricopeptide repeat-containing protein At2g45350, chloroplastic n=1 Tax=Tarenaya hassleriana TaxID=28532 RepID=UPI00053C2149|nr:PREDICTED: pentatricopeptide repeat-containing protein At2g45350, chloroplastic [Tarenaya hassleriana]